MFIFCIIDIKYLLKENKFQRKKNLAPCEHIATSNDFSTKLFVCEICNGNKIHDIQVIFTSVKFNQ